MKTVLRLIFCTFLSLEVAAQTEAVVTYKTTTHGGFSVTTTLQITGSKSEYSKTQKQDKYTTSSGIEFFIYPDSYTWQYDSQTGIIKEQRKKHNYPLLRSEDTSEIEWEILEDTKMMFGYKVQKAQTTSIFESRVRPYGTATAWFAIDLPYPTGPERYHSLPGLIMLVEFSEKPNEKYIFQSIEFKEVDDFKELDEGLQVSYREIVNTHIIDKKWLKANSQ